MILRVFTSLNRRAARSAVGLLAALCVLGLADPARGQPAEVAGPSVGDRIGACFGREDPACAEPLLAELERDVGVSGTTLDYCKGVTAFLSGRLEEARTVLQRVAGSNLAPPALRERASTYVDLATATAEVHAGSKPHPLLGGRVIVHLRPGPDEVLLGYLERVLAKAVPELEKAFGSIGGAPIALYVYPRAEDLGRVSGLTVEQIRASGTIALCKHNRVMITSPQDLVFGYPWADTVVHELVHFYIIKRGGPQVPVWLHEGLARALQGAWRGLPPTELDREERGVLAQARKKGKFIPLQKMSPSLALLPTQDDTQLAFAEVHHAVAWLLDRARKQDPAGEARAHAGRLVALFGGGLDETAALQRFSGLAPAVFVQQWRRELSRVEADETTETARRPQPLVFRGTRDGGLKTLPGESRRFAELGDRLAVAKRPLAAAIEYRKALAAGGVEGPLLVTRLVRVLLDLGKVAEALEHLAPARDQFADHAPLHVLAARAAVAQGQFAAALEATDQAAWINPYDPQVHALAAQAHAALGHEGDAQAARSREQAVAP